MSKLSIVIPVWNKYNFTKACLNDLSQLPEDHEIVVVDNASTDETQSELQNNARIQYIRNSENLGFAKACNIGFSHSSGENVLFLNNDIRVKSNFTDWTQPLIEQCANGLVGPTMGQLDAQLNFVREAGIVLTGNSYMSGWCVASSKENWEKLTVPTFKSRSGNESTVKDYHQVFSEEFGLAYFEDTDLGFRARKLGIPMIVVPVPVVHFGKQTSKQLNTHQLYTKARQIFVKKWSKI